MAALGSPGTVLTADLLIGGGIAGLATAMVAGATHPEVDVLVLDEVVSGWGAKVNEGGGDISYLAEMFHRASPARGESRGRHLREDFPRRDDADHLKRIELRDAGGEMAVSLHDVPAETHPVRPWATPGEATRRMRPSRRSDPPVLLTPPGTLGEGDMKRSLELTDPWRPTRIAGRLPGSGRFRGSVRRRA